MSRSELGPVQRVFALDRVELLELSRPAPSAPRLTPLVTGAVLLAIIVFGPALAFPPSIVALLGFCAAAVLAALHIWIPGAFALHPTLRYLSDVNIAAILLLIVLFAAAGAPRAWPERRLEILAVVLFLGIGFNARWEAVSARLAVALSSDARFVQAIAGAMTHPYDTAVREPLWLWGVRLAMIPFGDSPLAPLMFTFCCAMLLLAATFWFVRRYFTPAHALGVLALLAVHSALVESAAAAHRTELYAVLLVGVACSAFLPDLSPRGRTFGLATTISLTVLAQTAGFIPAVGGALASPRVRRSVSWMGAVVIGVVLVVLILPRAVYTARKYGQAFYFSRTLVPTFYRNYEFMNVKRTGCDGCPSPQEMAGNSYSGRPTSMAEYLFKLHTVQEVLSGLVAGYARTFVVRGEVMAYLLGSGSLLGYVLYVTGMFSLLATRARELLVILQRLERTRRFNLWMGDAVRPFVGDHVLEIGAGIGNLTEQIIPRERYVATDLNATYLEYLTAYALGKPYLEIRAVDVTMTADVAALERQFDTVLLINVLEHVADPAVALRNVYRCLAPDGRAIVLVPQHPWLYGSLDRALGHRERYTRAGLEQSLRAAGFVIERILEFNRASLPGWWLNGRVLKRTVFSRVQLKLFDVSIPFLRRIDGLLPWPSQSLIAIARRPEGDTSGPDPLPGSRGATTGSSM